MARVTTGVCPVFDIVFNIGTKGLVSSEDGMTSIKDIESFSLSVEGSVEKWNPMDQGRWGRTLATTRAVTVSLRDKRSVGDKGNDYVYIVLWKDGLDCSTEHSIKFPDGSSITDNYVLDVKATPGGDSTNVAALELDIILNGKSTFVPAPATPEGGAQDGT